MLNDEETKNSRGWFKDPDSDPKTTARKDDGGLFGWTVLILILIGVAIACWIGSFYIFGHPEKPLSYEVLSKLKKIDSPKRFELTAAPRGEFLRAPEIMERYSKMTPRQLARTNETLLRNYIRNFKPAEGLVPYVLGTFNILDSFELGKDNLFPSGVVALAQSKDNPNLLIEQIFCADKRMVPALHRTLLTGIDIDLKRENELAAIINVERLKDGRIKLTTVSILYPSYDSASADGTFSLEPPTQLNLHAGLPVVTPELQREADEKYDHFRRKARLAGKDKEVKKTDPAPSRLVRVEKPLALEPTPVPVKPAIAVATPPASVAPVPSPSPTPVQEMQVRAALPVETPVQTSLPAVSPTPAAPVAEATPAASPVASPSPEVAATPSPTPPKAIVAGGSKNWQVYEPGRMPRGRLLSVTDMVDVAKRGTSGERLYLQGNFMVTAAGADRAVMRSPRRGENIRVIVQYPDGMKAPGDGSNVARDARRPFQVMEVKESTSGQINVYVREVTSP